MRIIKLKEGEWVRVLGKVEVSSPYKKKNGVWIGGSSWNVKNPLILIGKCKHKNKVKQTYWTSVFSNKRNYCKGRIVCVDCGHEIKEGIDSPKSSITEKKK